MEINTKGFEVKRGGQVETTSLVSALSGDRLTPGTITKPVPGVPGVFMKLKPGEAANLSEADLAQIVAKASALYSPPSTAKKSDRAED